MTQVFNRAILKKEEFSGGKVKKEKARRTIKRQKVLYSVTTIVPGWPSEISKRYGGKRTPVICTSLRRAKQIVENNEGDIFETTYGYAVIDKVLPNVLYSFSGSVKEGYKEWWYEWEGTHREGKYVPCSKPTEYIRTFGFSIG